MRLKQPGMSFLLIAFFAWTQSGVANGEDTGGERFQPIDVFQLEYASDPRISPDGRRIVYVRNFMDIMKDRRRSNLWIIDVDGSDHRPITSGNRNDSFPRLSPDGKRLAYVSKSENTYRLHCRWLDTGQTATLSRLGGQLGGLAWSPDGKSLAFSMFAPVSPKPFIEMPAKPKGAQWAPPAKVIRRVIYREDGKGYVKDGYHQIFVLPAEGGTPRQLTRGPYQHQGPPSWSADGKSLVFSANRNPDWEYEPRESELYEVSLEDRSIKKLTRRKGPDHSPVISPDGRRIAWLGFDDKRLSYQVTQLYVMNRDGGGRRLVTKNFDRDVQAPVWSEDGKGLFFQYDEHGDTKIGYISLNGDVRTLAGHVGGTTIGRPYASGSFSVSNDGTFTMTQTRPDHPADVAVGRGPDADAPNERQVRRLTSLNADLLEKRALGETEEFWYESSFDKRKIQGWVVKPPGFDAKKKYPLILEIHGGPFANYGGRFSTEIQLYAAAGYVVLYANPRGSTGYGQEFGGLIHHDYPGRDYDDLMSGVDAMIRRGFIDEHNLFVTGGSGGGVLTSWIVGKTDRFRAAVAAKPVINWYSFVLTSDIYPFFNQYWFPAFPWDDPQHYLRRSPISLVGNVKTPTMLITGEADHRTPISESEQFYQALKLRKVDAVLVRIPGASHAIAKRPSNLIAKVAYILKWFDSHKRSN